LSGNSYQTVLMMGLPVWVASWNTVYR